MCLVWRRRGGLGRAVVNDEYAGPCGVLTFRDFASVAHGIVRGICTFLELCDAALLGRLWAVMYSVRTL